MKDNFVFHYVVVPPDAQLGLHSQPTWELSAVVCGAGKRIIGADVSEFASGDLVLIPPGFRHVWYFSDSGTNAEGCVESMTLMFTTELILKLTNIFPSLSLMMSEIRGLDHAVGFDADDSERIRCLLMEMRGKRVERQIPVLIELLETVSLGLSKSRCIAYRDEPDLKERRLRQIEIYVACNYARKFSIKEISSHLGINASSFSTFFRKSTGKTFVSYLNEYRLKQAKHIIETEPVESISNIAYRCGFETVSHFNHLFKTFFGITPRGMIGAKAR